MRPALILVILALLTASGCAVRPQRSFEVLQTVAAIPEIEQRQVLKNLARTVENPYSLPFYSVMTQSQHNLRKRSWARRGLLLIPYVAIDFVFDLALNRVVAGSLTTTSTTDADRLELMQTAYQLATRPAAVDPLAYNRLATFLAQTLVLRSPAAGSASAARGMTCLPILICTNIAYDQNSYIWVTSSRVREFTRFTLLIQRIATVSEKAIPSPLPAHH